MGHLHVTADIGWKRRPKVRMLVDTGATHSVLPVDLAPRLDIPRSPRTIKLMPSRSKSVLLVGVRPRGADAA